MTELRPVRRAVNPSHPMRVRGAPVVTRRAFEDFKRAPIEPMAVTPTKRPLVDRVLIILILACSTWIALTLIACGTLALARAWTGTSA